MATVEIPNRINLNKDEPAKPDAQKPLADGEKPKVKAKPRDYSICRRFSGKKDALHKAIDEMDGDDGTIYVVLGQATHLTTKGAMEKFGKANDLSGKYLTVAESAFTEHNVKTELEKPKRRVTFS